MNERVALSLLLAQNREADPPLSLVVPFAAMKDEAPVLVTAVLERTVAYHEPGDRRDTGLVRIDRVFVDPAAVEWKASTAGYEGERLHGSKPANHWRRGTRRSASGQDLAATRANTDQEALKNQRQVKQAKENEMRFLRQRSVEQAAEKEKEAMETQIIQNRTLFTPGGSGPAAAIAFGLAVDGSENAKGSKLCKRCTEQKPRSEFAATGIYGGYCATCEPLEKADRAAVRNGSPKPAKASKRKYAKRTQQAAPKAPRRAEFGPSVRHQAASFKELIERIVGERDALKARVDELEAERAQAFAQLQEVLG